MNAVTTVFPRDRWKDGLDRVSNRVRGRMVDLELFGPGGGPAREEGLLLGLGYDEQQDMFWLYGHGLREELAHPAVIAILERAGEVTALDVRTWEGQERLLLFRPLPALESRASS